jgi:hypothetical protein
MTGKIEGMGRRGRRRYQLPEKNLGKQNLLEIDRKSSGTHSVETSL